MMMDLPASQLHDKGAAARHGAGAKALAEAQGASRATRVTEAGATGGNRRGSLEAEYHYRLAMEAARRMRRTRKKQKTSHIVCHHLKMMLAADQVAVRGRAPELDERQYRLGL